MDKNMGSPVDRSELDKDGRIIADHPTLDELDAIRKNCINHTTKQKDIIMDYDPFWQVSSMIITTDINTNNGILKGWKHIKVTPFNIPKSLRYDRRYVKIFVTGLAIHEAGHVILSKPVHEHYVTWIEFMDAPICNFIYNILEDARINNWIQTAIGGAIALSSETVCKWSGRVWLVGFEKEILKLKKTLKVKWSGIPPGGFVVSAIAMNGLYGQYGNNEEMFFKLMKYHFPNIPDEYMIDMAEGIRIIREASEHHSWYKSIRKDANDLYKLFAKYILKDRKAGFMGLPLSQPKQSRKGKQGKTKTHQQSMEDMQNAIPEASVSGPFITIEDAEKSFKERAVFTE